MFWSVFHALTAVAAVGYAMAHVRQRLGLQHLLGAQILLATSIFSFASRYMTESVAPLAFYCVIDATAICLFGWIMLHNKAAWAALCVLFHTGMVFLHFAYYATGQANLAVYAWTQGILFSASVLTVTIATWAGRHGAGERWDNAVHHLARGWTWTGMVLPRLSSSFASREEKA